MSYNAAISRTDAAIPTKVVNQIFESLNHESLVLKSFTRVPMTTKQETFKIIDLLPFSFFQNATDTGYGQTTRATWQNKTITAEKLMCFVPIDRATLDDAEIDIFASLMPKIVESMAFAIDNACLFGVGSPVSFPSSLYAQSVAAGTNYTANTAAASGGISEDMNRAYEAITKNGGYRPTHILGGFSLDSKIFRGRDTTGQRYLDFNGANDWNGVPILKGSDALFSGASGSPIAMMLVAKQVVVGLRQDITVKVMEEMAITDPATGLTLYNAGQQDLVILRVTFRFGWQVAGEANVNNMRQGTNEVQTLTQSSGSGNMTVSFGGYTTVTLDAEASAAAMQTALENLVSIGAGNISVARSGSAGARVYTLTFQNALGSQNVAQVTATIASGTLTPATTTPGVAGSRTVVSTLLAA